MKLGIVTGAVAFFSAIGLASAATTTPITIAGVPANTFCSTYAKDLATKSVAINLVLKIRDNPSLKPSLMRQYGTFTSLGKIHCKNQFAPSVYGFTGSDVNLADHVPYTPNPDTSIDISNNTPIITTTPSFYRQPDDYFTGYDTTPLQGLNSQQLEIVSTRITKAKAKYAAIVDELIRDGRLGVKDKDEMVRKISFKFSNNCNQLDGRILVRQWYDQNNNPLETELINLFITINLCFTSNYENNYESFLERIIYHELGHFYQYFYDRDNSQFTSICRKGDQSICPSNEFVSSYAASSPDEDYAETFAFYVHDKKLVHTPVLQAKVDYFKIRDPRY